MEFEIEPIMDLVRIERKNMVRIILIFLLSLIFVIFSANWMGVLIKDWIQYLLNILEPDFRNEISIIQTGTFYQFHLEAITQIDLYRYSIPIAPAGSKLFAEISILHSVAPSVLIVTLCLIPCKNLNAIIAKFLLACGMSILLISLTTPFLLAYHLEVQCLGWAENFSHQQFSSNWIIRWTELMELGGQWLLAVLLPLTSWIIMRGRKHLLN